MENKTLEIVVYKVKEEKVEEFEGLLGALKSACANCEGFVSAETRKSIGKKNQYVDVVYWDSWDASKKAARMLNEWPEIKQFFSTIEETIVLDHFDEIVFRARED